MSQMPIVERHDTGNDRPLGAFGVYCHVPFCTHRCDYCAFATWTDREHLVEAYMAGCRRQARDLATAMPPVTSVFFGGGTPNLAPPRTLGAVVDELPLASGAEITVECNPDLVTPDQMRAYRDIGVNRISLGVQSMSPRVLDALGRRHDAAMVGVAAESVRQAGIGHLNMDLIFGAVNETLADWEDTLCEIVAMRPDHLSVYGLTVEAGTPLAADERRHPDDDDMADKYLLADNVLASAGYENYEISNWALRGAQCAHNQLYWRQGEYAGLGCAAHSHRDGRRFWSVRTPERFVEAVESGSSPEAGSENLDAVARRTESLQLAVRTSDGVPASEVPDDVMHLMTPAAAGRLRLTVAGRLLANEVAIRLGASPSGAQGVNRCSS